jgi:beta-lactamase superfamily II metal-dependent hydrolase
MSIVKSYSVGNGDMFFIEHNSDNFTMIDCCLSEENRTEILDELATRSSRKGISRFVATHPDEDHLRGLSELDDRLGIVNFYCVMNEATKEDESEDFRRYRHLHNSEKAFFISKGSTRKWMNLSDEVRDSSGIFVHWPDTSHEEFKWALEDAAEGLSPNNLSPIIEYRGPCARFMWMGDLETEFLEAIADDLALSPVTVLFAPHHGRDSGKVPSALLEVMDPQIIVIGEAPSQHLNYYAGYSTITQNSAGDIIFDCLDDAVDIYVGNSTYSVNFLHDRQCPNKYGFFYIGSLVT